MTAIPTISIKPQVIDLFASQLPEGPTRKALNEMALMLDARLTVATGYIKISADRVIMKAANDQGLRATQTTCRQFVINSSQASYIDQVNGEEPTQPAAECTVLQGMSELLVACKALDPQLSMSQISIRGIREALRLYF
ncbi:MAG: hypothetical protein IPJ69_10570 [Deltaproteobacteria bacterium]|nr:MAG: hypothetical protein IPJ69_10570 [Deltaproteobacteria bacterium]